MEKLKTSLNSSFYEWVSKVRSVDAIIAKLEDDLEYYSMKLVGYNSPSFDVLIKSNNQSNDDRILYWTFKIVDAENKIKNLNKLKTQYNCFKETLSNNLQIILDDYCYKGDFKKRGKSTSGYYSKLSRISRKFLTDFFVND